ncbi:MAG: hypothetical protein MSS66_02815 [Selenomonadaceae bacterium]|nr:hypothetical protein [Selenomonadaceae bacterium]
MTKGIKQSDGTWLTPMQQMIRYANAMNYDEMPRWGISCNFQEFMIFDPMQICMVRRCSCIVIC